MAKTIAAVLALAAGATAGPQKCGSGHCEESILLQTHGLSNASKRAFQFQMPWESSIVPSAQEIEAAKAEHEVVRQEAREMPHPVPTCTADMTGSIPACMQYSANWCWATVTSQMAAHFDPTHYPAAGREVLLGTEGLHENMQYAHSCFGLECKIVGMIRAGNVQGACCDDQGIIQPQRSDPECAPGAAADEIKKAIMLASWQDYHTHPGPLSEADLVELLSCGHPIGYAVFWKDRYTGMSMGGHIMIIGGCAGEGKYWVHDSLSNVTRVGLWQALTWDELMHYNAWGDVGMWPVKDGAYDHSATDEETKEWFGTVGPYGEWSISFVLQSCLSNLLEKREHQSEGAPSRLQRLMPKPKKVAAPVKVEDLEKVSK